MLLSTILLNFYKLLANNGDVIAGGQDGILATTLATSYIEIASGMAFDSITDTSNIAISTPSKLTIVSKLGPDNGSEDSLYDFNDFDDFNNFTIEEQANGTTRKYKTTFKVQYVSPGNVETVSSLTQTFTKRMDLSTWRTFPPGKTDTLKLSMVLGYFHFD
jgi:hypothetical protein